MWGQLMDTIDIYFDNVRWVNFLLLVTVIAAMTATIVARRKKATRRVRRIMMWIYLIFCNFTYATADNIHDRIRVNPPVIVTTFLLSGLFIAFAWNPEGDDKLPPEDGSIGSRVMIWFDSKIVRFKKDHGDHRNP